MYTFHSSCSHPAHNHISKKEELIMNMNVFKDKLECDSTQSNKYK